MLIHLKLMSIHRDTPGLRYKIPVFSDPAPGKSQPLPMNKRISEQPSPWRKSCERESCYGDRVYDPEAQRIFGILTQRILVRRISVRSLAVMNLAPGREQDHGAHGRDPRGDELGIAAVLLGYYYG